MAGSDDTLRGAGRSQPRRLSPSGGLRLEVGERWLRDARLLSAPGDGIRVGAGQLKSPVDIVIRGENTTAEVPEEPVLPFLLTLCQARRDVCSHGRVRAVVNFVDSPWQVCLRRIDYNELDLSVIETTSPGKVRASREPVSCRELRRALERCVTDCLAGAHKLPPGPLRDETLGILMECRNLNADCDWTPVDLAPGRAAATVEVRTRLNSSLTAHTIVYTDELLASWTADHGDDAELLAASGLFCLEGGDDARTEFVCCPLHVCSDVVRAATRYVDTATSGYEHFPLFRTESAAASVRNIGDRRLQIIVDGAPIHDLNADIVELHRALLLHVRDIIAALNSAFPPLTASRRLSGLSQRAIRLASNTVRRRSGRFRIDAVRNTADSSIAFDRFDNVELPWSRDEIRMLAHRRTWTMRAPALRSTDVAELSSDHWLVRSGGALSALRLSDGDLSPLPPHPDVTRARIVRSAGIALVVAPGDLLIADARSDSPTLVTLVEDVEGPVRWADAAGPPGRLDWALLDVGGNAHCGASGGSRHRIAGAQSFITCTVAEPRRAVFAGAHGDIQAWDTISGQPAWCDNVMVPLQRVRAHGEHLIAIGAHEAGSIIVVFDAESGRRLQTIGGDDTVIKAVVAEDGFAAILGWGGGSVNLTLIDLATGELRMRTSVDDSILSGDSPQVSVCSGLAVVSTRAAIRAWSTRKRTATPLWTVKGDDLLWHSEPAVAECAAGPDVVVDRVGRNTLCVGK